MDLCFFSASFFTSDEIELSPKIKETVHPTSKSIMRCNF